MATGAAAVMAVDSRVICSVCLEPYKGRQPKLLPCFHTYCLPCLLQLSTTDQGDTQVQGASQAIITCPSCRAVHTLQPGGVSSLQTNFYIDDSDPTDIGNQADCATSVTQRDADPSDDLRTKVQEQMQVMEAVVSRLSEEEKEIERQKRAVELDIRHRYQAGLHVLDECRDHCLTSVEEATGRLTDKLQADLLVAHSLLKPLQALAREGASRHPTSDPATDLPPALLTDPVLRHFRQLSAPSQPSPPPLFSYSYSDNMADLKNSLRHFMGAGVPSGGGDNPQSAGGSQRKEAGERSDDVGAGLTAAGGEVGVSHQQTSMPALLRQLQSDNEQLRTEVAMLKHSVTQDMDAMKKELPAVRNHVGQLQTDVATVMKQMGSLQTDLSAVTTATTDIGQLQKDMTTATTDIGQLQKDLTSATTVTEKLQKDTTTATIDIGKLQKDMTTATTDFGKLQKAITTTTTDIGKLQKDMTTTTADIGKLQKALTTATTGIGKLQKDMTTATTGIGKLQKDAVMNQQCQKKTDALVTTLRANMDNISTPVFFNAVLIEDTTVEGCETLKLDKVVSNTGGGYDVTTSVFTAPRTATYLFFATARAEGFLDDCLKSSNTYASFNIMAAEQNVATSRSKGFTSCTAHAVVQLQAGQQTYLKTGQLGNIDTYSFRGHGCTSFCGMLLYPGV